MGDPSDRYAETFDCGCEWHAGSLSPCEKHRGENARTEWRYTTPCVICGEEINFFNPNSGLIGVHKCKGK